MNHSVRNLIFSYQFRRSFEPLVLGLLLSKFSCRLWWNPLRIHDLQEVDGICRSYSRSENISTPTYRFFCCMWNTCFEASSLTFIVCALAKSCLMWEYLFLVDLVSCLTFLRIFRYFPRVESSSQSWLIFQPKFDQVSFSIKSKARLFRFWNIWSTCY